MTDRAPREPAPGNRSPGPEDDRTRPAQRDGRVLRFSLLRPGAVFAGRYEMRDRLGTGGTGEVYEALDRVADELVAIKVLFPHLGEADALARLRRELHAVRQVHHPGIVRVHDIGEHDGLLFLVMERLHGETLADRIRERGALAPGEIRRILRGILDALAAAHREGVLHRDVKPANVFLDRDPGGDERVVLLDFGLARGAGDLALTATGQFLGTPRYASPEQARGERVLTPAADLWSVGILLWEMAVGEAPWGGEGTLSLFSAQARGNLPKPPPALRDLPRDLRRLLDWLLSPDPRDRPRDAGEALAALAAGRGASLLRRLRCAWRAGGRRRAGIAATAAAAACAAALVLFFPWRLEDPRLGDTVVRARSLAGLAVRTFEMPCPVGVGAVPFPAGRPWTRRWYVRLAPDALKPGSRHPFPEDFPLGIAEVDLLLGRVRSPRLTRRQVHALVNPRSIGRVRSPRVAWLREHPFPHGRRHVVPGYDGVMGVARLVSFRHLRSPRGYPLLGAIYHHRGHSPSTLLLFSPEEPDDFLTLDGDGYFYSGQDPIEVAAAPGGPPRLLVVAQHANRLDDRLALVAVDPRVARTGSLETAPPVTGNAQHLRPAWTTYLGGQMTAVELEAAGDRVLVHDPDGLVIPLAAATGTPLRAEDRGGISPETWLSRQRRLLLLLWRLPAAAAAGTEPALASQFEDLARLVPGDPAQRGVALGRAAMLREAAGDLEGALRDVRAALALEPGLAGHWKRLLDILVRRGEWNAVEDQVFGSSREVTLGRDLVLGALLAGRPERGPVVTAGWELAARRGDELVSYYWGYTRAILALHRDDPGAAARIAAFPVIPWKLYPEFAYLGALAAILDDPPRPRETLDLLAPHEDGFGAGHAVPVVPLRALAARLAGRVPPSDGEIEADVRHVEDAARTDIVSLYFLPWAHALAAASVSDPALAGRHEARLRELRGCGPWTRPVLALRARAFPRASLPARPGSPAGRRARTRPGFGRPGRRDTSAGHRGSGNRYSPGGQTAGGTRRR